MGALPLLGRSLPFHFKLANGYRAVFDRTCNVLRGHTVPFADLRSGRAYGGNHGSKPQLWRVSLHKGVSFRSIYPIVTVQCLTGRSTSYADAQRLSRLRRAQSASLAYGVPYESKRKRVCFLLHIGSSMEASKNHNPTTCKK